MKIKLLRFLDMADAIYVNDSPLLLEFPTEVVNGFLWFDWWDVNGLHYEINIPEAALDDAAIVMDGIKVKDTNGDDVIITPYELTPLLGSE